jgi:hypothetical protein
MGKRPTPPRDRRGRLAKRRPALLPAALVARLGARVIAIGTLRLELPMSNVERHTNPTGRWRLVDREDDECT